MQSSRWIEVLFLAVLAVAVAAASATAGTAEEPVVGELIDQGCYLLRGDHGPEHQECGARCLRNGNPAGVLTEDGDVFTLAAAASAFEGLASKRVRVSGERIDRTILPQALEVWEDGSWVEVPLTKFGTPEKD